MSITSRLISITLVSEAILWAGSGVPAGARGAGSPQFPFSFVENRGQADRTVRFIGNGPDFRAWFYDRGVTLQQGVATVHLRFGGGNPKPIVEASDPTGAAANYIRGGDEGAWRTGLPMFGAIHYRNVWPEIEVRFKAEASRAKAEYVVAPHGAVADIRLAFDGDAEIRSDGSLVVATDSGEFREDRPYLYQERGSRRVEVKGGFRKLGDGSIGFSVAAYDPDRPLVIDPPILFSGYFGGLSESTITSVVVNSSYNVVAAGWTIGTDLPASAGYQNASAGNVDAFVATFSPAGGGLLYCTYLGGSGDDRAFGVTVDGSNNIYVTGWTQSKNFPVANALQTKLSGTRDAFVTKLNPAGSALIFSTYLGGTGVDDGNAITLDASNSPVIVGDTTSTNLPATAGAYQPHLGGLQDAFVAKLAPSGASISLLTYFGGSGNDHGAAIALDATGAIYIGGNTYSLNLPTVNAAQPQIGGGQDGFVARLAANGQTAIFSTYLGGSGGSSGAPEEVNALAVAPSGTGVMVGGTTSSVNFPVTAAGFQKTFGGGQTDGFLTKFTPAGALGNSTYLGGSLDDSITALTYDWDNWVYATGYTTSTDFPVLHPTQPSNAGGMDAFIVKMTATQMLFSTYLGGLGSDCASAIAIDSMTSIVVAGTTSSSNYPVAAGAGRYTGAALSSFVTKLAPNFTLGVAQTPGFVTDIWHNTGFNGAGAPATLALNAFGQTGDRPVSGDWTHTGVKRIGVFRHGTWLLDINNDGVFDAGDQTVTFGQAGDIPVVGDWNGTGQIKLGLFRQGSFILDLSGHLSGVPTGLSDATFPFGLATDIPVVSDWNNSGTSKVGVFRNGSWLVDYNGDQVFNGLDQTYTFGQAGDLPVVGDWNSSGTLKIGVYRHGVWILDNDGRNALAAGGIYALYVGFGSSSYVPLIF